MRAGDAETPSIVFSVCSYFIQFNLTGSAVLANKFIKAGGGRSAAARPCSLVYYKFVYYSYNTLFHLSTCVIVLSPSAAHTPLARRTGGRDAVLCMGSTGDIDGYRYTRLQ